MQAKLNTVAVYCGSNSGSNKGNDMSYRTMAKAMAEAIVEANLTLIYGGGQVGLMGEVADTVLKLGGKAIGVITQLLVECEVAHQGLTELHVVSSMHERKALMASLADSFVMLPGGPGTWDEFFEIITWGKLGYHKKPCGILNSNHYYDFMLKFLDHAVTEKFLHVKHRDAIFVDESPKRLLQKFLNYQAPVVSAWMYEALV